MNSGADQKVFERMARVVRTAAVACAVLAAYAAVRNAAHHLEFSLPKGFLLCLWLMVMHRSTDSESRYTDS